MSRKWLTLALATGLAILPGASALIAQQQPGPDPNNPNNYPAVGPVVPPGTRFMIGLNDKLNTGKDSTGKKFKAKTLEPLVTGQGLVVPPGAEVRGHVSRVEPAGLTGRAKLWLSFDDIKTPAGRMPLIAQVIDVPGEQAVKPGESKEGEIESRTSHGTQEAEAAAAGAAIGAVVGGVTHGGKGAGIGAAIGGVGGFLLASGYGQELQLPKGTKIELELERPLYVTKY